jgi:hypothetical protein
MSNVWKLVYIHSYALQIDALTLALITDEMLLEAASQRSADFLKHLQHIMDERTGPTYVI